MKWLAVIIECMCKLHVFVQGTFYGSCGRSISKNK